MILEFVCVSCKIALLNLDPFSLVPEIYTLNAYSSLYPVTFTICNIIGFLVRETSTRFYFYSHSVNKSFKDCKKLTFIM